MSKLEVYNVVKHLGGNLIVDHVSFTVETGEFFVLLGPSGSGKSTLMRLICGLEKPDSGQIIIDGRDVTDLPPRERNVGMVFQDYGLYPNMDVYGNIAYGLQTRGMKRDEIARRIPPVAEKLKLDHLLYSQITDLSGGEQQRVALARALAKDADLYLYDEPLSNLDPKLRGSARRDITMVHRQKQKPSLYVTHDQIEAFALADRIALLGGGKLQQVGSVDDLINAPANMYVAGFIGQPPINMLDGELRHDAAGYEFVSADCVIRLPETCHRLLTGYEQDRLVIGLRPDALSLDDATVNGAPVLIVNITEIEAMLGETIVNAQMGDQPLTAVLDDISAENLAVGEPAQLTIDPDRIMLFDPTTEAALG